MPLGPCRTSPYIATPQPLPRRHTEPSSSFLRQFRCLVSSLAHDFYFCPAYREASRSNEFSTMCHVVSRKDGRRSEVRVQARGLGTRGGILFAVRGSMGVPVESWWTMKYTWLLLHGILLHDVSKLRFFNTIYSKLRDFFNAIYSKLHDFFTTIRPKLDSCFRVTSFYTIYWKLHDFLNAICPELHEFV